MQLMPGAAVALATCAALLAIYSAQACKRVAPTTFRSSLPETLNAKVKALVKDFADNEISVSPDIFDWRQLADRLFELTSGIYFRRRVLVLVYGPMAGFGSHGHDVFCDSYLFYFRAESKVNVVIVVSSQKVAELDQVFAREVLRVARLGPDLSRYQDLLKNVQMLLGSLRVCLVSAIHSYDVGVAATRESYIGLDRRDSEGALVETRIIFA